MSDPISVRHVMATADITERITKAEAATNQALGEEFAKELSRQEDRKQTKVNKQEEKDKVKEERRKKKQDQEKKHAAEQNAEEAELEDGIGEPETKHIIDLQV